MLVLTSDIHLTDKSLAPSVPKDALNEFTNHIEQLAKKSSNGIKLILLGDIFDVLRSSKWLAKIIQNKLHRIPENERVAPWHAVEGLEDIIGDILTDIYDQYHEFFKNILSIKTITEVLWVPGNHDRLVKITQNGRKFIEALGIRVADYEVLDEEYGVFARHGHFHDEYNIRTSAGSYQSKHELSPFGDAIVIDIANGFQVEVARKRRINNFNNSEIAFLGEMEYLTSYLGVPLWVHERTEQLNDEVLRDEILKTWCEITDEFFKSQMYRILSPLPKYIKFFKFIKEARESNVPIQRLASNFEKEIKPYIVPDKYKKSASKEQALNNPKVRYIIYGHTHECGRYNLGGGKYYINTGCWKRSYKQSKPYMNEMCIVKIDKAQKTPPDPVPISINEAFTWDYPYSIPVRPIDFIKRALETEIDFMKNALLKRAVINIISDSEGVNISTMINPMYGFDMHVHNKIRGRTYGNQVAVRVTPDIEIKDIDMLAEKIQVTPNDRGWIFTVGEADENIKIRAMEKKITIFDGEAIRRIQTGKMFTTYLQQAPKIKL